VHCARSACKKKLINSLVTVLMHSNQSFFFVSSVGWNISPAHTARLSPAPFCFGLEHQPSRRGWAESSPVFYRLEHQPSPCGWAESSLVAGPIQAQPSPVHFIYLFVLLFSFLFCVFFIIIIYIYFWKLWFSHGFFYVISTNIGLYFYILKIQIRY